MTTPLNNDNVPLEHDHVLVKIDHKIQQAHLTPAHDPRASPVTPDNHGVNTDAYLQHQDAGAGFASPSTDAIMGLSNIALSSLHRSPSTEQWADAAIEEAQRRHQQQVQWSEVTVGACSPAGGVEEGGRACADYSTFVLSFSTKKNKSNQHKKSSKPSSNFCMPYF